MTFFLGLLKSLDELLYEVISWRLFWPLTLWKTLRHPRTMLAYARAELKDAPQQQFNDTLQPPLFLVLAILLVRAIELATVGEPELVIRKIGLAGVIDDDTSLMALRLVSFGALPLILAARLVRRQGTSSTARCCAPISTRNAMPRGRSRSCLARPPWDCS